MFYKIGVLKNFAEFTWKQLRSVTLIKKTPVQVLSCEFCEIFKNPFWQNTSGRTASGIFSFTQLFFATQWTNRNQVFSIFEHVLSRISNVMNIMDFAFGKFYFVKKRTQLLPQENTHFSETPRIKQCFLSWLPYQYLYCTPLSCNSSVKSHRCSCRCDSLIQRCSLKKLFLNI